MSATIRNILISALMTITVNAVCDADQAYAASRRRSKPTRSTSMRSPWSGSLDVSTSIRPGRDGAYFINDATEAVSVTNVAALSLNYELDRRMSFGLTGVYIEDVGFADPTTGPVFTLPVGKNLTQRTSFELALPTSKDSKEQAKITAATLTSSLIGQIQNFQWTTTVQASQGFFGKLKQDKLAQSESLAADLSADASAMEGSDVVLEDEAQEGSDYEVIPFATPRELSHFSIGLFGSQSFTRHFTMRSGVFLTQVRLEYDIDVWAIDATLIEASYDFGACLVMGAIASVGEGEQVKMPDTRELRFALSIPFK